VTKVATHVALKFVQFFAEKRVTWSRHLTERRALLLRGGLVCQAHRLVHHSTLGVRVTKKKTKKKKKNS
jgi:hypothetical protein